MNTNPQGGVAKRICQPNAGVGVSKEHLDLCLESTTLRVGNDASGWDELTAKLLDADVDLVVIEATGGYERGVVCALQQAGVCVARVNPRQSRDFAKSMGVLAKTDRVDARTLRDFANVLARHEQRAKYITPLRDERRRELAELIDANGQNSQGLPLSSELMRVRTSHRGTLLPIAACSRRARDGEVPFIRWHRNAPVPTRHRLLRSVAAT